MNKFSFIKLLLILIGITPIILITALFFPDTQKYLIQTQLNPWISQSQVKYIHVTPFSIKIEEMSFNYDDINIQIGHVDAHFSLFKLFSHRIKINKLIINNTKINDQSIGNSEKVKSNLIFLGLFPYLESDYIVDIGQMKIEADYTSSITGPLQLQLEADSINEKNKYPIKLKAWAKQLPESIPDIRKISLDAAIILNQSEGSSINAEQSIYKIEIISDEGQSQFIKIDLAMKQLALPNTWDSFPFENNHTHYLKKIVHPESINLKLTHNNNDNILLSEAHYIGEYNGNNGLLSGVIKLSSDKKFLQLFKSLQLPDIQSQLSATFEFNTRSMEGKIDIEDEFTIEDYVSSDNKTLPEKININNHLTASITNNNLSIKRFLLKASSEGHNYIDILTHKTLSINLNNPTEFLNESHKDLLTISIEQLPLKWFSDFLADYKINDGQLNTVIDVSVLDKTLKISSRESLSLEKLDLSEMTQQSLLAAQNLRADFLLDINDKNLMLQVTQLEFYPDHEEAVKQASSSINLSIQNPFDKELINNTLSLKTQGKLNINELIKIPLINKLINELHSQETSTELSKTLPGHLNFDYDIELSRQSSIWTVKKTNLNLSSAKNKNIVSIKNIKDIQIKQNNEQFVLLSTGELASTRIKQFHMSWFTPIINQYTRPLKLNGIVHSINLKFFADKDNEYKINIEQLKLAGVKVQQDNKLLFENINLNAQIKAHYTKDKITLNYPLFVLTQKKTSLLENNGSVTLHYPDNEKKQQFLFKGKLKGHLDSLSKINFLHQITQSKISKASILNADYTIQINKNNLTLNPSDIIIYHPQSKGKLEINVIKPILISLDNGASKNKKNYFSSDGHLAIKLSNFDFEPYKSLLTAIPITFEHANGHFDLIQKSKIQTITIKEPLKLQNIHYKDKARQLLNPFDLTLIFAAKQTKNTITGKIQELSVLFKNQKQKSLALNAEFRITPGNKQPLSYLNSHINIDLTHWLSQPGIMPDNTLKQGSLTTQISINKQKEITHHWLISNLVDDKDKNIIKSISIDGTGHLKSLSDITLDMPITMQSLSGNSYLDLKTHIQLSPKQKQLTMTLDAKEFFLNDLFKLLTAINPQSELSQLEKSDKKSIDESHASPLNAPDNTPDSSPFWPIGINILSHMSIDKLYYSDYMSFHDIKGDMTMSDKQLQAKDFSLIFHDSPMQLNSMFLFNSGKEQPYNIDIKTTLDNFPLGGFLTELDPKHIAKADGVFDVDIKFFGELSNLSQFRNELLFDLNISGRDGVYHLIPADDAVLRSSGHAMAVVGEIVSVLPTSGFGLGIVSRVVRFAKDIQYDFIELHMTRQNDLNTRINQFRILSPELHLFADGEITFQEHTRLFNQPMKMKAQLNVAGEGAAIFYGLGLLENKKDQYGFWYGPEINFWGTLNNQQDDLDDVITQAKQGTLLRGITNPFSGLIGDFKYRWFGDKPDYSQFKDN